MPEGSLPQQHDLKYGAEAMPVGFVLAASLNRNTLEGFGVAGAVATHARRPFAAVRALRPLQGEHRARELVAYPVSGWSSPHFTAAAYDTRTPGVFVMRLLGRREKAASCFQLHVQVAGNLNAATSACQ